VPEKPLDAAKKGVVSIERSGHALALGALLRGDGRILTALSPLTHGNQLDARYSDGSLVHVRITHSDRASDLALLTPEGDFSRNGLRASQELPPDAGAKLHAFRHVGDKNMALADMTVKARVTLRGGDGAELENALELNLPTQPTDLGGPLLDDKGEVVAISARACASSDKAGCTLAPYAATATSLRRFLRAVPPRKAPSIGVDGVSFDTGVARGVRLISVQAESRAALAGLHGGEPGAADVVVAVDGVAVTTPEAMNDAVEHHPRSQPLRLLVLSGGVYREVSLGATSPRGSDAAESPKPAPAGPRQDKTIQSGPWPRGPKPAPGAAPPPR
jgi:serine protease Do